MPVRECLGRKLSSAGQGPIQSLFLSSAYRVKSALQGMLSIGGRKT